MFERILVPLDGSARAEQAIPVAARLAWNAGGNVRLLRVAGLPSAFVPYSSADPWTAQKIIDADTQAVDISEHADVIAMATHGYSGIRRLAIGSITERVLHACRLPLLVVRPANMIDQHPQVQEQVKMVTLP